MRHHWRLLVESCTLLRADVCACMWCVCVCGRERCGEWGRTKKGVVTVQCVFLPKVCTNAVYDYLGHKILLYGFSE